LEILFALKAEACSLIEGELSSDMTAEEIQEEAVRLPLDQRSDLVSRLISTLGPPSYDVDDQEVGRRIEDLESGRVEDISHNELLSRLKHVSDS
jgi:hypothetical protein